MTATTARNRLLTSTIVGSVLALTLAGAPAWAQTLGDPAEPTDTRPNDPVTETQADDPTEEQTLDEVVVTGSRLRQRDLVANSPIETVDAETLENAGTLTVETFLNQLPQIVPSVSSQANNPSQNGAAVINLRGLGSNRNLVLLNGRRLVGSNQNNVVDVNVIPTALIERIEVISGGASAVYGADAVAGVVNFVLKNDFEGVEFDGQYQISERDDAKQQQFSVTIGSNFAEGRGNAVANFSYANREALGKGEREFTAQATNATSYFPSGTYRTAGNLPSQAAVNAVFGQYNVAAGLVPRNGGGTGFGFNGDGTLFATGAGGPTFDVQNFRRNQNEIATAFFPDTFSFNFEPLNLLVLPLERQSFSTFINYDISDRVNVYGQGIYTNYNARSALAPSPAPTGANPLYPGLGLVEFTIPVTNPFIPADLRTLLASRTGNNSVLNGEGANEEFAYRFRTNALGPRVENNEVDVYNILLGAKVELTDEWEGDVYYSQGRYLLNVTQTGNLAVRRFEQLLDSPTGGTEFCAGGFNPFGVGLNADCARYVSVVAKNQQRLEQDNVVGVINGPLFELPAGDVQVAFGAEYRSLDFNFIPDSALQPGEVAGFNGQQPLSGFLDFYDLFTEASIPLLRDLPFARSLEATFGFRTSRNNRTGTDNTYKAELSWVPVDPLRFRASYQKAVRSPTVGELFAPQDENNPEIVDPCNATNATGAPNPSRTADVLKLCTAQAAAAGFSASFLTDYFQSNAQADSLVGGNPDLQPEQADSYTVGAVYRPTGNFGPAEGLEISVDYYKITIEQAVASTDESTIVRRCYNLQDDANPTFDPNNRNCALFGRSPGDFGISDLLALSQNQGLVETSGVDLAINARLPLENIGLNPAFGEFRLGFIATFLNEFIVQTSPEDPALDFAGTIGDDYGDTLPELKLNVNIGYNVGKFGADLRGRYIDSMNHEQDVPDETASATGVDSAWYWDLATRYALNDVAEVRFGVLNLFDREIEEYDPFIDAQTDPSTYDVIGRRYFVGLNLRF